MLVQTFYLPVFNYLSRWGLPDEDRKDLTQEVFLRVLKGLRGFRGEAKFGTWVYSIARNTCQAWLSRRHPAALTLGLDDCRSDEQAEPAALSRAAAVFDDPLASLIANETSAMLRQAIAELPTQMQRCTRLRVDMGLKVEEIATVLRLSPGTVKAHLSQAREKLRPRLLAMRAGEKRI